MVELDEAALICDLAETYQIYDYRSLPVQLVATLSAGLRDNSRIKLKAAGSAVSLETIILATIADNLTVLRAGFDSKNKSKPFLFTEVISGDHNKNRVKSFKTSAEFEAVLSRIRGE